MNVEMYRYFSVTQDNRISQSAYSPSKSSELNRCQKRFLLLMASHIEKGDDEFKIQKFKFRDFMKIMGIKDGGNTEKNIRDSIESLNSKTFLLDSADGKKSEALHWVDYAYVDWDEKTVNIRLSESLKAFYLNLSECFTSFSLGFTTDFTCKYSYRVYEFLHSYSAQGKIIVERDKAFRVLGNDNYDKVADFERYVLRKAVEEINEYSDLVVNYYRRKSGRKVTHFFFIIKRKSQEEINEIRDTWVQKKSLYEDLASEFDKLLDSNRDDEMKKEVKISNIYQTEVV